jgi:exopolysaccharide production protein ExoQ
MHPNLLGFIFGAGCLILLHQAVVSSGRKRAFYIISAGFCVAIIFAAAARASLLALAFSVAFVTLLFLNRLSTRTQRSLLHILIGGIFVCLIFGNSLYFFLSQLLELESSTRGFESGGSGRVELWQQGFDLLFSRDLLYALIGGGLRSASPESIGFSTESSYITILLESGILFGGFLIASIIASVVASIRSARQAFPLNWEEVCSICIVLYVMFESIFNRYMIAIGNNLSLVLLMIIAKLSIVAESRRSAKVINLTNPLNSEN